MTTLAVISGLMSPGGHAALPTTPGWHALPQTQLRSVCPANNFGGTTYSFNSLCPQVVAAWNSAVLDTTRNRLIVWGGGHNDYAGNELYALNLADQTIQRLNNPSVPTNAGGACTVVTLPDGKPNVRHTYDGLAYIAHADKMFVFGGSPACAAGGFSNDTWIYDFATSTWQKKNPSGPIPKAVPGAVTAYDAASGKVFLHDDWNLYSYDLATDAYTRLGGGNIDYHLSAVIDPVRKKLLLIGGGQAWAYDIGPGSTYVRQTLSTTGGGAIVNSLYPGLAFDPVSDRVVAWNGGDTVYSLNVATGAWTPTTFPGGPGAAQVNGTYKRWSYSPASGVFVLVNSMTQDAYALRLGAAPPPTPDTTPDAFTFEAKSGVAKSSPVTSGVVTIAGINAAAPVSISGGTYSIDGAAFTNAAGTVASGGSIRVQLTAADTADTQACATLSVGGVSAPFCATTLAAPSSNPGPLSGGSTTRPRFTLQAPTTQSAAPFTVGLGFRKGDVTNPVLDIPEHQVIVMRRWNDGSVKHAIASGLASLTAGTPTTVNASNAASAPGGTSLTAASIQAANPQASIAFGSIGTVNLSSLLATPFRTFVAGPQMVEAHYRGAVGSDPTLVAWFHVRLYKGGRVWVRAIAENGYLDVTPASKNYVPTVTVGGTQAWNNGGASLTHHAHTRWAQEAWIGGDPQVTPQIDTAYLKSAKLVPNFLATTADPAALTALYQNYAPNQNGNWTVNMGDTGYQDQIGLLPVWDSLYVTSNGDARAYRSVVANAKALNSYPIGWIDSVTKLSVKPSDRPGWSTEGAGGGGSTSRAAGNLSWEIAHHGSGGYLAYLITGDYYHLETMEGQAATAYLMAGSTDWTATPSKPNLGTSRYFNGQTRGYAWVMRTLSQYVGIAPTGNAIAADYTTLLANNVNRLKALKDTVVPAGTGYVYEYDASLYGTGLVAPWQQHFFMQALGMGSDLEPLADMTAYNDLRNYLYRGAVGILGDASGYCFTQAAVYNLKSNAGTGIAPNGWYKTWAQVYAATFATPPACGNTLAGSSGGDPALAARGYWGNLIPAIAYAVDHGAPGASAAWARLSGASNWSAVLGSGFEKTPTWGVAPRQASAPVADTVPDPFAFPFLSGAALNATATSAAVPITGIDAPAAVVISGGSYSVNGAAYTTAPGTVSAGNAVAIQLTTSAANGTQTCATLTIGGSAGQFCATTLIAASDTTPNPFSFAELAGVASSAPLTSNAATIGGIDAPSPISIEGGSYSVDGGAYATLPATIGNGSTVTVRFTSAAGAGVRSCATLTIGGVAGPFCATTLAAADTSPDAFTFTPQTNVATNTAVISNAITVSGINAGAPIDITGGTYSIDAGAYRKSAGTVSAGNLVRVRVTSSNKRGQQTCASLTIGGIRGQFCATTTAEPRQSVMVERKGTGSGIVVADKGSLDCGNTCTGDYPEGTTVTLTAVPDRGSRFAGWLGACTGMDCRIKLGADAFVLATFAPEATADQGLDVDGNGVVEAATDGMMILRYLLGRPGAEAMTKLAGTGSTRTDAVELSGYLDDIHPLLDIDGDGETLPSTDALLILRYLDGVRGEELLGDALGAHATRTSVAEIEAWLHGLLFPATTH